MKKSDQISSAKFLTEYRGLDLYDEDAKKKYTFDHEDIHLFNKKGWALVGITDEPGGRYTDIKLF